MYLMRNVNYEKIGPFGDIQFKVLYYCILHYWIIIMVG